jgi:hypothetical protein
MADKNSPQNPKREPPDPKGHKPHVAKNPRQTGETTAEKAAAQESPVHIGDAWKREHNL